MKKVKFKERIENARNAFFDDEDFDTNDFLSHRNQDKFLQSAESEKIAPKISSLETVLKQALLFFPGTFILYILSAGFTIMFINTFVNPSGITPRFEFIWLSLVFLAATLMTWIGLGDVRKQTHLVIPASIAGVGIFFGAFATILITFSNEFEMHKLIDNLAFYLFPLALIAPFLAKGWVDRKYEN